MTVLTRERTAAEPWTGPGGIAAGEAILQERLLALEERALCLRAELLLIEARLRELRRADGSCPNCGGTGMRSRRGGLYGEQYEVPCSCRWAATWRGDKP